METVTLTPQIDMNKIIAVPVSSIRVAFNIRYGWDAGKILDAYQSGIDELETSIRTWGFKPNEPLEVYDSGEVDDQGQPIYTLVEGHRRFAAIQSILSESPEHNFGNGLASGEIWAFISPKSGSLLDLLASQFDANKSQGNTRLDTAKAIYTVIESGEVQGKKIHAYRIIGERIAGLKSWQSVESFYMTYQLPDVVKDWIQESELNEDLPIALSFSTAAEIVTHYGVKDASALLTEALKVATEKPETVKLFGNKILKSWLHELAVKLKLGKTPPTTATKKEKPLKGLQATTPTKEVIPATNEDIVEVDVQAINVPNTDIQPENISQPISNTTEIQITTQQSPKSRQPSTTTTPQPQERVKTLILKMLVEKAGEHIVNGRSDVDSGIFIIELPAYIGEDLAKLISSLIDPLSNPHTEVSPVSLVEDM
jgi:hypothetical protein